VKSQQKHWLAAAAIGYMVAAVAAVLIARTIESGSQSGAGSGFVPTKLPPLPPALAINDPRAFPGYTLFGPLHSTLTYLIDTKGRIVRTWNSPLNTGVDAHLLGNGSLLHSASLAGKDLLFCGAGEGGRLQEITWDGQLIWDFKFHNPKQLPHHAITPLPNGHILMIVWEPKSPEEAVAAGREPEKADDFWLSDSVVEIEPTGRKGARVVWEWHAWDHTVQDYDRAKANFGDVAAHPELVDVNFRDTWPPRARLTPASIQHQKQQQELDRLRSIGYLGNKPAAIGNRGILEDWLHINAAAYNAELDQIILSVNGFCEIWIIDHSTTPAEAAGHTGGRSERGGDLLYRWGNPRAYRAGTSQDQRLFRQHDAHWIDKGVPGGGHVLIFNNGPNRPGEHYSSVDEIVLPSADAQGRYGAPGGKAHGPEQPFWTYSAPKHTDFFAEVLSGAQRLPNGNTLICDGEHASVFEVTPQKDIVWKFTSPVSAAPGLVAPYALFRAYRYGLDYAGLKGKAMTPGKMVEEICSGTGGDG
jgi:hypothetical protein